MNQYEKIAQRALEASRTARESGKVLVQLPIWDDDQRSAPAVIVRSALFGLVQRGKRKAVENHLLVAWGSNEILYTGFLLDQTDMDVWLEVMHRVRMYPLGREVRFTAREFLKSIGRKPSGQAITWLRSSLVRMQACGVSIRGGDQEYTGPLIFEFFVDRESGRFVVRVNPLIADLFDKSFVKMSVEKRLALPQGLPRKLYEMVTSHKATEQAPQRIGMRQLQSLCRSENTRLCGFRRDVRRAMEELQKQGIVVRWCITSGDALEFVRP